MNDKKGGFFLQDVGQMKRWAGISGVGFVLYLAASAVVPKAAVAVAVLFGLAAVRAFLSVLDARTKDKESVTYNLLWGTGALALMLVAFAALEIKMLLGF